MRNNYKNILSSIGNTPLIKLNKVVSKNSSEVWLKLESVNPTGSHKDRMAVSVLINAMKNGALKPDDTVIEYTGGSTGTALAFVSAVLGLKFVAIFSDAFSKTKQQSIEAYGAEVVVEQSINGQVTPELIKRMKDHAYKLSENPKSFYVDQFGSPYVRIGYRTLGNEIVEQLNGELDVFCASVGSGGVLMGTFDGMIELQSNIDLIALEPTQSPFLTKGFGGPHKVEGIGVGFEPPFLDRSKITEIRAIDQVKAFNMCRRLAREEGVFCGGSTGLNVVAALEIAKEIGSGKRVVTLACDNGIKYLGEHIYK